MVNAETRVRDVNYRLYLLHKVCLALQGTFDVDKILHIVLTSLTAGGALGFSRAAVFFLDRESAMLKNGRGVGPADEDEAAHIWSRLAIEPVPLVELFENGHREAIEQQRFPRMVQKTIVHLDSLAEDNPVAVCLREQRLIELKNGTAARLPSGMAYLAREGREVILLPLLSRGEVTGLVVVDNAFHFMPIDEPLLDFLALVVTQAGFFLENARDYLHVRRSLEQVERLNEKLKDVQTSLVSCERFAAIGKISAYLAHEIRNPLVAIGGFAQQILSMDDPEKVHRNAEIIVAEVKRLEMVLNNLFRFSSGSPVRMEQTTVGEIFEKLLALFEPQFEKRGARLVTGEGMDVSVYGDALQLGEVFFNLVANALDSIEPGGTVFLRARRDGTSVAIEISDDGCGIAGDEIEKIFAPFYTTKSHGMGLGLSVVRTIVEENHHGSVHIASEKDKGTTVTIRIPTRRENGQQDSPDRG